MSSDAVHSPTPPSANDNLRCVETYIACTPDVCWRALTDASLLAAWVPGLRRARVIDRDENGRAREVLFEFSASLTYSLVYSYDVPTRELRWEPRMGKRDGVRGYARLDACDTGTRMTYALEQGPGRSPSDLALGDPEALLVAFARWVESRLAFQRAT
ncbi:MAG TPA: SRPBCC family protein [Kofleriaceae bacterium]|nr:SRPBCC family protein [Kofleriaceae bacterium]